jgi:hypothetical protein
MQRGSNSSAQTIAQSTKQTYSQVISGHIKKSFKAREPELQKYLLTVRKIEGFFLGITTKPIPRIENSEADELAKAAAHGTTLPLDVSIRL